MSEKRLFTIGRSPARTGLVTFLLAAGTFAFGAGEFASMSLLPGIAADLGVPEGQAGHMVTAYALGVVIGAPVLSVVGARWPRKPLLLALLAVLAAGNLFAASAHTVGQLVLARFFSGIPHGAFIGTAMLMAVSIVPATKQARAVSSVQMGIATATILGVPLFTLLSRTAGWRASYVLMAGIAAAAAAALWAVAPNTEGNKATSARLELTALRNPKVLLTLVTGAIGFGGIFAVYSYFTSAFEDTGAGPAWAMSLILMLYGLGSVLGSWAAGFVNQRILLRAGMGFQALLALSAALYALGMGNAWTMGAAMVLIGAGGGLVVPLQTRLLVAAGDARALAAAMNHVAFNLANGLGPLLAGATTSAGLGWSSTGWVAVALAAGGLGLLGANVLSDRRSPVTRYAVSFDPRTGRQEVVPG